MSIPASADLSSNQYYFVELDANGRIGAVDAQGAKAIGVLQDKPAALGRPGSVAFAGISKVVLGGDVTAGNNATSTATGTAEVASSDDYILGTFLESGSSGETVSLLLSLGGRVA